MFATKYATVLPYVGSRPVAIAEYATRTDHSQPGRAANWLIQAFDFAGSHNIVVAMAYYDSSLNSPDDTYILDKERTKAMALCRQQWNVAQIDAP